MYRKRYWYIRPPCNCSKPSWCWLYPKLPMHQYGLHLVILVLSGSWNKSFLPIVSDTLLLHQDFSLNRIHNGRQIRSFVSGSNWNKSMTDLYLGLDFHYFGIKYHFIDQYMNRTFSVRIRKVVINTSHHCHMIFSEFSTKQNTWNCKLR